MREVGRDRAIRIITNPFGQCGTRVAPAPLDVDQAIVEAAEFEFGAQYILLVLSPYRI